MKKFLLVICISLMTFSSCKELLEPKPVNVLTTELVLTHPDDVENVRIGLYNALRSIAAPTVIIGDFTADMIVHRGTYVQLQEFGNKQITASNSVVEALWQAIYAAIYTSNFVLEKLPDLGGVPAIQKRDVLASARFVRGYAFFIGAYTFGDIPAPFTTNTETNKTIPKTSREEILKIVLEDYQYALQNISLQSEIKAFAGINAVKAALARYYLYAGDWANAEKYATEIIDTDDYELVAEFSELVEADQTDEAILEMGYSIADDPGTTALSLNDLFVGRREVIPSNKIVSDLNTPASGDRSATMKFDLDKLKGSDHGWSVAKYGTVDEGNNDIILFRLGEIYLIRAEARAMQDKINGAGSALEDLNIVRARSSNTTISSGTKSQTLALIEQERIYELAFEGHRWYDLKRTGRLNEVMMGFSNNWKDTYNLMPIPLREIQNNPSLIGQQNPGY